MVGVERTVNVQRFEDVLAFYQKVEPFLMQDEVAHNLILGLCSTLILSNIYEEPPYLGYCEHEGEVVGVALRTPPHNLILSKMTTASAIEAFACDAYELYGALPGVTGLKETVAQFAHSWQKLTGQTPHLRRTMRSFRLDKVIPVHGVSGEYCPATDDDFELMTQWSMDFAAESLEAMAREDAEKGSRERLASDPKVRGMRFWVDNGERVSMVGYGGLTPNGIRIGPVYTPPEYRRRGYASALTAAVSQEMLDNGRKFVSLYTDLSNPTSNHIYQTIGYRPVHDVDQYHFETAT
jgi:predicted GNAT family acetyltransferase